MHVTLDTDTDRSASSLDLRDAPSECQLDLSNLVRPSTGRCGGPTPGAGPNRFRESILPQWTDRAGSLLLRHYDDCWAERGPEERSRVQDPLS
jgi:hypothetical protein